MDPRQQPQPSSSSQHLRPPPHHRPSPQSSTPSSSSSTPRPPPAKISADPSATISDSVYMCGPYQIYISKGAVIHPRTRICASEGPIRIGEGCVINEKAIVGTYPPPPPPKTGTGTNADGKPEGNGEENAIVLSTNAVIGSQTLVHPGVKVHSGAVVDSQVVVGRGAEVGAHSKICARTELSPGARVKEWVVVFGGGKGGGVRTRAKARGKVVSPFAGANVIDGKAFEGVMEGSFAEDARLLSIKRERDALARLIVGMKRK
ncbi:hypothetical protein BDV18DRAFT_158362 [Aspergillus unguis]